MERPPWSGPRGAARVERPSWSDPCGATPVVRPAWSADGPVVKEPAGLKEKRVFVKGMERTFAVIGFMVDPIAILLGRPVIVAPKPDVR